jgi:hypothetical protein
MGKLRFGPFVFLCSCCWTELVAKVASHLGEGGRMSKLYSETMMSSLRCTPTFLEPRVRVPPGSVPTAFRRPTACLAPAVGGYLETGRNGKGKEKLAGDQGSTPTSSRKPGCAPFPALAAACSSGEELRVGPVRPKVLRDIILVEPKNLRADPLPYWCQKSRSGPAGQRIDSGVAS